MSIWLIFLVRIIIIIWHVPKVKGFLLIIIVSRFFHPISIGLSRQLSIRLPGKSDLSPALNPTAMLFQNSLVVGFQFPPILALPDPLDPHPNPEGAKAQAKAE